MESSLISARVRGSSFGRDLVVSPLLESDSRSGGALRVVRALLVASARAASRAPASARSPRRSTGPARRPEPRSARCKDPCLPLGTLASEDRESESAQRCQPPHLGAQRRNRRGGRKLHEYILGAVSVDLDRQARRDSTQSAEQLRLGSKRGDLREWLIHPAEVDLRAPPGQPHRDDAASGLQPDDVGLQRRPSTNAVPRVGWPAKGSSIVGVKIRIRATEVSVSPGRTKALSDRFISVPGPRVRSCHPVTSAHATMRARRSSLRRRPRYERRPELWRQPPPGPAGPTHHEDSGVVVGHGQTAIVLGSCRFGKWNGAIPAEAGAKLSSFSGSRQVRRLSSGRPRGRRRETT
jgi:hypothetical protein